MTLCPLKRIKLLKLNKYMKNTKEREKEWQKCKSNEENTNLQDGPYSNDLDMKKIYYKE